MQIPARKISIILLAVVILKGIAFSQTVPNTQAAPTVEPPAVKASNQAIATPPGGIPSKPADNSDASSTSTALDYLYNHKAGDGTVAGQAVEANEITKNRAIAADALGMGKISDPKIQARFEKYLGMKEIPASDLTAYAKEVQKITDLLHNNRTFEAWKELQVLGSYQAIDAGVSYELANRIESIWNTDKASNHIDSDNAKLREQVREADNNADVMSDSLRKQQIVYQKQGEKNGKKPANNGGVPSANSGGDAGGPSATTSMPDTKGLDGRLQLTEEYLNSLEGKAKIKLNELKEQNLLQKTKANFANYTKTLFDSGRQQHTILAAEFYLKIFDEDEYPAEMGDEVNASLQMISDVQSSIEVFRYKADKNEIAAATARLQDAFTVGEFQSAVLGLERSEKDKVADFSSRLDKMENLIEARDFATLETQIKEAQSQVADFDASKALALVNAVKLDSKLHLGKAKLFAQQGDLKTAMDEFQEAAKAWPGNPALQDSSTAFFDSQDVKSQSTTEFDRLVVENNYRELFDKQLVFATAVRGDAKREEQLKSALEKIKSAEIATEKANLMRNAGDVDGAWETVELASKDLPNDNKLNSLRAELAGKGAEFVEAINKAKDAETRSDLGYSLTWYAVAQQYYPASIMANEAIDRLSKQILGRAKSSL